MISRATWKEPELLSFSKTSNSSRPSALCYFDSLKNSLVRFFFEIALETMLLPIQAGFRCRCLHWIRNYWSFQHWINIITAMSMFGLAHTPLTSLRTVMQLKYLLRTSTLNFHQYLLHLRLRTPASPSRSPVVCMCALDLSQDQRLKRGGVITYYCSPPQRLNMLSRTENKACYWTVIQINSFSVCCFTKQVFEGTLGILKKDGCKYNENMGQH